MIGKLRISLLVGAILWPAALFAQNSAPSVLLVSFDGFRYDYIDKHDLKNFKAFRVEGSAAEGLIPCYPSLTFPNHYSIVTGMYPQNHGLVDNNFYDSSLNLTYSISNRKLVEDPRFYGGTPLWTLAKRAGMKTASYFWVGSEITDRSIGPDIFFPFDGKVLFTQRIDSVVSWLKRKDDERPRFITMYFNEPDHITHDKGPNSPEAHQILLKMDSVLGYLMNGLSEVKTPVNTILVSDHGMADLVFADETFVFCDELYDIKSTRIKTVPSSGLAHLYIDNQNVVDSMYTLLKSKEKNFKVYKRKDIPKNLHYNNNYRIGDIVMIAEPHHYIRLSDRSTSMQRSSPGSHFGVHGFDPNVVTDMRGIFLAKGPQIRKGEKPGLVRNIDIYPLVAKLLGLKVPQIDGDPNALRSLYLGK